MNQVNQTVLALLRGAVWGEKITLSAEADWAGGHTGNAGANRFEYGGRC